MHAGLVRLLELIRVNPQDSLLVDRFLILATDLEETMRADATLSLSEALLRKNPRRAIELAHMVYKAKPSEPQPIELMVEGLENLGRYGKATVLRAELEKIRKANGDDPVLSREVTESTVMTIEKELKFLAGIDVAPNVQPSDGPVDLLPMRESLEEKYQAAQRMFPPPPRPKPMQINPISLSPPMIQPPAVAEPSPKPYVAEPTISLDALAVSEKSLPLQKTSVASAEFEQPVKDDIPHKIEVKETPYMSSLRLNSQVADGVPMYLEVADDVDERDEIKEPPVAVVSQQTSISEKRPQFFSGTAMRRADQLAVEQVRAFIDAQAWDSAWLLIEQHWPDANNPEMIQLFREMDLARIDLRFMGWWIDALVNDRRARYALVLMLDILREQPHMSIAKILLPRIQNALRILNYDEINWAETEGILALLRKLDLAKLQTLAAIAIFRPRHAS